MCSPEMSRLPDVAPGHSIWMRASFGRKQVTNITGSRDGSKANVAYGTAMGRRCFSCRTARVSRTLDAAERGTGKAAYRFTDVVSCGDAVVRRAGDRFRAQLSIWKMNRQRKAAELPITLRGGRPRNERAGRPFGAESAKSLSPEEKGRIIARGEVFAGSSKTPARRSGYKYPARELRHLDNRQQEIGVRIRTQRRSQPFTSMILQPRPRRDDAGQHTTHRRFLSDGKSLGLYPGCPSLMVYRWTRTGA